MPATPPSTPPIKPRSSRQSCKTRTRTTARSIRCSAPKKLDWHGIAAKVGKTLGIPVTYEPIDIPTFAAGLTAPGASPYFVQHVSNVAQDYRDGIFAGVNNLVEVIGGTKPITVEDYVAATRSQFDTDGHFAITDARLRAA
jgi:hypothetical protein